MQFILIDRGFIDIFVQIINALCRCDHVVEVMIYLDGTQKRYLADIGKICLVHFNDLFRLDNVVLHGCHNSYDGLASYDL